MTVRSRGTSNTNDRGSAESRRRRKAWLLSAEGGYGGDGEHVPCYRCRGLLDWFTMEVDRIIPGARGGRYVRGNIRPACGPCNRETGCQLKIELAAERAQQEVVMA